MAGFFFQLLANVVRAGPIVQLLLMSVILFSIHCYRGDGEFVSLVSENKKIGFLIHFLEYMILSLPLIIYFLYKARIFQVIIFIAITLILSLLPSGLLAKLQSKRIDFSFIPINLFELKLMFERNWVIMLILISVYFDKWIYLQ